MIGIVVAAHAPLAEALVETARAVLTTISEVEPVNVHPDDDAAGYEARLRGAIERVAGNDGVLVLTDMLGGTPSNIGLTLHRPGEIEVLTGANLPMLLKALRLREQGDLLETSRQVKSAGQAAIRVASEVLGQTAKPAKDGGA